MKSLIRKTPWQTSSASEFLPMQLERPALLALVANNWLLVCPSSWSGAQGRAALTRDWCPWIYPFLLLFSIRLQWFCLLPAKPNSVFSCIHVYVCWRNSRASVTCLTNVSQQLTITSQELSHSSIKAYMSRIRYGDCYGSRHKNEENHFEHLLYTWYTEP